MKIEQYAHSCYVWVSIDLYRPHFLWSKSVEYNYSDKKSKHTDECEKTLNPESLLSSLLSVNIVGKRITNQLQISGSLLGRVPVLRYLSCCWIKCSFFCFLFVSHQCNGVKKTESKDANLNNRLEVYQNFYCIIDVRWSSILFFLLLVYLLTWGLILRWSNAMFFDWIKRRERYLW